MHLAAHIRRDERLPIRGSRSCAQLRVSGLLSITRSLAKEFAGRGVRVNALAPGMIETVMGSTAGSALQGLSIPLGRYGTAEEVATAAVFLASAEATWSDGGGPPVARPRGKLGAVPYVCVLQAAGMPRVQQLVDAVIYPRADMPDHQPRE